MNDKLTLAQIRAAVRRKLDDDQYDATTIDEAANDFQNEIFASHRIRSMEASADLAINTGDTSVEMPRDFLTMLEMVIIEPNSQFRSIKDDYVDYNEFMRTFANYSISSASRIGNWTDFGNGIRLSAPSDGDYSLVLDYLRQPKYMERDNDRSEFKRMYRELIVLGTLARVMEVNEDYAEGSQERDKLDGLVTSFVRNEGRGGFKIGPNIIATRRRRIGTTRRLGY